MPKRLKAFLRGSDDAHPGDYLVAIVAVIALMSAIAVVVIKDMV